MEACKNCSELVTHKRGVPAHDDLDFYGYGQGVQPVGQSKISYRLYKCKSCGAMWEYADDKNDSFCGWSRNE